MKRLYGAAALLLALIVLFASCQSGVTVRTRSAESGGPSESQKATPTENGATPSGGPATPSGGEETPTDGTTPDPATPVTPTPVTPTPVTPTPVTPTPRDKTAPEDYVPFTPTEKVVAITFDDGPCWITPTILDVIEGTGDKVTFFIVGEKFDENKKDYPSYVKRAYDMGCEIGSHTEEHVSITGLSGSALSAQLDKVQARFKALTGDEMTLLRPPGGAFKNNVNYGCAVIDWSLDSQDWAIYSRHNSEYKEKTGVNILYTRGDDHKEERERVASEAAEEVAERVISRVKPGDIVLMHDIWFPNAEAFSTIYKELKAQGYRFVTVSELLNINGAEYAGWYFNSTSDCGHDGRALTASAPGAPFDALLPEKIF